MSEIRRPQGVRLDVRSKMFDLYLQHHISKIIHRTSDIIYGRGRKSPRNGAIPRKYYNSYKNKPNTRKLDEAGMAALFSDHVVGSIR
jgi:hypothetical protein